MKMELGLCLALMGCGAVNPITAARLAMVSPLDADPAGFAVQVDLPEGLAIQDGSARLAMAAFGPERAVRTEVFVLQQAGPGGSQLAVDPADLMRFRALQAQARAWEAADPEASDGSINVDLTPCVLGDGPDPGGTVDVSIRIVAGGPLMPLVRDGALSEVADAADIANLPRCVS